MLMDVTKSEANESRGSSFVSGVKSTAFINSLSTDGNFERLPAVTHVLSELCVEAWPQY